MKEIWVQINNYSNYEVSNYGNIRNKKTGRIRKQTTTVSGYKMILLSKNSKVKNLYVHRLVAEAFFGKIPAGYVVNHRDFDRINNKLNNLETVRKRDNIAHSVTAGRYANNGKIKNKKRTKTLLKAASILSIREMVESFNITANYAFVLRRK